MKTIFSLIIVLICCLNTVGQSPDSTIKEQKRSRRYHVNYWVTGSIIGVGMVGDIYAISRLKNKSSLTMDELIFVNSDQQKNLMNSILV